METIQQTPSYRKVAPVKIPPLTDKKIKPQEIFEGMNQKKPAQRKKQKKKGSKRDKSRK